MAIQIDLTAEDTPFGMPLAGAYLRVYEATPNLGSKTASIKAAIWANKTARDANKQSLPVTWQGGLEIKELAQPEQRLIFRDEKGEPVFEEIGGQVVAKSILNPAIPAFAEVLGQIVERLSAGEDYRDVGYALIKTLPFVKDRNPQDV